METKTEATYLPYKVKDISLADWGRKEIHLAEAEMPGLMGFEKNMETANLLQALNCWLPTHDNTNRCIN